MDWCSQQLVHKAHNKTEILAQNNHNKPHLAFFTHEVVGRRMYLHFLCHKSKAQIALSLIYLADCLDGILPVQILLIFLKQRKINGS